MFVQPQNGDSSLNKRESSSKFTNEILYTITYVERKQFHFINVLCDFQVLMLMIASGRKSQDGVEVTWKRLLYQACPQYCLITLLKNKRKLIFVSSYLY